MEGSHEAIINPDVFDMVQDELAKRVQGKQRYSGVSIFSGKIKCADCGGWYGSKVWHSTDKYRKIVYRCNNKYKGEKCRTAAVTEEEIKAAFISAFNQLVAGKKEINANAELMRRTFCATEALQEEKFRLASEMSVLSGMMQKLVEANARVAQNQEEYTKQYNDLVRQYDEAKAQFNEVVDTITAKGKQKARLGAFISALKNQEGIIDEFTPDLWGSMVDFVTVGRKKEIKVTFRDGTEIMA